MGETAFELAPECDPEQPAFWAARIEAALGLPPLAEFATGAAGATRFIQCGEDSPDRVLSCTWGRGGVWVESVAGFAGWGGRGEVVGCWRAWLRTGLLPWHLRNWGRVVESVSAATSCDGRPMIGGPFFYHTVFAEGQAAVARWAWPVPGRHRRQWELVGDYGRVRRVGWCHSWFSPRQSKAGRTNRCT